MEIPTAHVAILPSPGIGHITPVLEFAKRLVDVHGLRISFYVITTGASVAQSHLINSFPVPDAFRFIEIPPVDVTDLIPPEALPVTHLSIYVRESLPALRSLLSKESPRPTVFVADLFTTDAFGIADDLHMSKYVCFPSNARLLSLAMYLPTLDREVQGEFVELTEPIRIPGCKPLPIDDLVQPMLDRKNEEYAWYLHHCKQYSIANGILLNMCEDMDPTTLKALREDPTLVQIPTPRVYPFGPLVKSVEPKSLNKDCLAWLDLQPRDSVLFVSFGSAGTLSAEQTTELAWGLELSQQRFLWVVRPPTGTKDSSAAFFTSGGDVDDPSVYLPAGFLERTEGTGMVVPSWAPQVDILRHGSVGGFLTHGGWNSSMESVVNGVPMIVWPLFAEQHMNASMLSEDLKVAVQVRAKEGVVGREEVEKVVRLLMEGEQGKAIKGRVKQLSNSVLNTLGEGGSSYNSLAEVVREWKVDLQLQNGVENGK